jgi:hypothetical protein
MISLSDTRNWSQKALHMGSTVAVDPFILWFHAVEPQPQRALVDMNTSVRALLIGKKPWRSINEYKDAVCGKNSAGVSVKNDSSPKDGLVAGLLATAPLAEPEASLSR